MFCKNRNFNKKKTAAHPVLSGCLQLFGSFLPTKTRAADTVQAFPPIYTRPKQNGLRI